MGWKAQAKVPWLKGSGNRPRTILAQLPWGIKVLAPCSKMS